MILTSGRIHVLQVDDEPGFAELTSKFLEREDDGFNVPSATSVGEGLDLFAEVDVEVTETEGSGTRYVVAAVEVDR